MSFSRHHRTPYNGSNCKRPDNGTRVEDGPRKSGRFRVEAGCDGRTERTRPTGCTGTRRTAPGTAGVASHRRSFHPSRRAGIEWTCDSLSFRTPPIEASRSTTTPASAPHLLRQAPATCRSTSAEPARNREPARSRIRRHRAAIRRGSVPAVNDGEGEVCGDVALLATRSVQLLKVAGLPHHARTLSGHSRHVQLTPRSRRGARRRADPRPALRGARRATT